MAKSLYAVRRKNLEKLIKQNKNLRAFCQVCDINPSYASHVRHKKRNPGSVFVEKVEKGLGLPVGWMDIDH